MKIKILFDKWLKLTKEWKEKYPVDLPEYKLEKRLTHITLCMNFQKFLVILYLQLILVHVFMFMHKHLESNFDKGAYYNWRIIYNGV